MLFTGWATAAVERGGGALVQSAGICGFWLLLYIRLVPVTVDIIPAPSWPGINFMPVVILSVIRGDGFCFARFALFSRDGFLGGGLFLCLGGGGAYAKGGKEQ